jgi:hypothetical protein
LLSQTAVVEGLNTFLEEADIPVFLLCFFIVVFSRLTVSDDCIKGVLSLKCFGTICHNPVGL